MRVAVGLARRPARQVKCRPRPDDLRAVRGKGRFQELDTGLGNRKEKLISTITTDRRPPRPVPPTETPVEHVVRVVAVWLTAHSITALRVSLGLVILGFGALKFIPGASPAEGLVMRTTDVLTFGLVSGTAAVVATAVLETFIGFTVLTGIGLRAGLVAMAGWLVGIMMPVVLFPADLFPGYFPTLEAQYVLKDVILAAAAAVVAAKALGARYVLASEK